MNDGRDLEDRVAAIFRDAGCEAESRVRIAGARAEHVVDIWATFESLGLRQSWAVECKDTSANVPKADVLTFYGVVIDVGASRGIMVATSDFQPGARAAADSTNLLLLTEDELTDVLTGHIRKYRLDLLTERILDLRHRIMDESESVDVEGGAWMTRVKTKRLEDRFYGLLGALSILQMGIDETKLQRSERYVVPDFDTNEPVWAQSFTDYCDLSEQFITDVERWLVEE